MSFTLKKYIAISTEHVKMLMIIYFIQFIIAGILGLFFKDLLAGGFGHSMESNKLLSDFDFTSFIDFLHMNSQRLISFIQAFIYIIPIWIMVSIVLSSGQIFFIGSREEFSLMRFIQISILSFWSQIRIIAFFLLILIVFLGLTLFPIILNLETMLDYFSTEKYVIWILGILFLINLLMIGFIFVCSTLARKHHLQKNARILDSIKFGIKIGFNQFAKHLILILLYFGILFSLLLLYLFIESNFVTQSLVFVFFLFSIQQVFVILKLFVKQIVFVGILTGN